MFYVEKPLGYFYVGYFYVAERRASRHARGDIMFYVEKPPGVILRDERQSQQPGLSLVHASRHALGEMPAACEKAWQKAETLG